MIDDFPQIAELPSWQPPGKLSELGRPTHQILSDFVHRCSPDPDTRTAAITCLVLSFWQLKGHALTPHVPSLLLVNAGEATDDPIDEFTRGLVYDEGENRPRVQTDGPFTCAPVDLAPKAMRNALAERRSLGADPGDTPSRLQRARELEERFHAAQVTGYGHGRCRPYSEAWHPDYGWITDPDDQVILRLNGAPDRAAFREDVLDDPGRLLFPEGIGNGLSTVPKMVSLSGSLTPDLCDGELASNIIALGLPFFLLPHVTEEPLAEDGLAAIESLARVWGHNPVLPVVPSLRLPISTSSQAHEAALRRHLANLPATYAFAVLQAVHQLDGVCDRIVRFAGGDKAGIEELVTLCQDLYEHTFRGIVIGVASLSYFERGFDKATAKLLRHLRERGATRCSALPGSLHIKAQQRDAMLERLGEEGLVRVEGGVATATPMAEFTKGLYAREEFSAESAQRADG